MSKNQIFNIRTSKARENVELISEEITGKSVELISEEITGKSGVN